MSRGLRGANIGFHLEFWGKRRTAPWATGMAKTFENKKKTMAFAPGRSRVLPGENRAPDLANDVF